MPPNPNRPDLGTAVLSRIAREQQQRAEAVQHARTALRPYRAARPAAQPQEG